MTSHGFEPGPPCWEAGDYFFYLVCEAIGTAATPVPALGDSEDDCGEGDGM
jgi:hypothetical protein